MPLYFPFFPFSTVDATIGNQAFSHKRCNTFPGFRACLHEGGGPQAGEVTRLGGVKNNLPLHVILQLRHPGVHFLNINEWSLST